MGPNIYEFFDINEDLLGPFLLYEDNTRVLLIKCGLCLPLPLNDDSTCNTMEIVHFFEYFYKKYGPGKYHFVYIVKIPEDEQVTDKYFEFKQEPQRYRFLDRLGYTIDATEQYRIEITKLKELDEWLADSLFDVVKENGRDSQPSVLYNYNN